MGDLDRQIGHLRAHQASAWVSALAEPGTGRHKEFIEWMKESPLNVREFLLAYSIDSSLGQLDSQRSVDIETLLAQVNPRVTRLPVVETAVLEARSNGPGFNHTGFNHTGSNHTGSSRFGAHRTWPYKVAAVIATVGLISWMLLERQPNWKEFSTGTGEQRALQLEDGSVVHLNAHSRIALNFSASGRDVKLIDGEALFEVHHDAQRPFRVFTRDAVIRDIGTRFNVYSRSDGVKVAVIEGSVELTAVPAKAGTPALNLPVDSDRTVGHRTASHIIVADHEAQVDRNGLVTVETIPDIADATAWWERRLVYRKETLAHIVEDFNRYNRRRIRLEGEAVMSRAYTGVFDADDPDSLAQVLASDPELVVERLSDTTIVVRSR